MDHQGALLKRLEKEKQARLESERLLELKADELHQSNEKLDRKTKDPEKTLQQLEVERSGQIRKAHTAGVAENAISVLHNVGNALTPAFIKIETLIEEKEVSQVSRYLKQIGDLFKKHLISGDLVDFLSDDHKGKELLPFLNQLAKATADEGREEVENLRSIMIELRLVKEIIDLQKKYSTFKSPKEEFSLGNVLEDVLEMMNPSFLKRNLLLMKEIETDLPRIKTDKNKIVQILLNLLKNAVESIDEKIRTVGEEAPEIIVSLNKNNRLICSIVDNGVGLSSQKTEKLFKLGYTSKKKGSGIGLHDCSNFIRSQGGELSISSRGPNQGAKVEFFLPFYP